MTDRERIITEQMTVFGVDRQTAEFIAALEIGEIEGDVVVVDDPNDDETNNTDE